MNKFKDLLVNFTELSGKCNKPILGQTLLIHFSDSDTETSKEKSLKYNISFIWN